MRERPTGMRETNAASRVADRATSADAAPEMCVYRWYCPLCGSGGVTAYHTERPASAIGKGPDECETCPIYTREELIALDPPLFDLPCDACLTGGIESMRGEVHL